jgi:deoxyribonuclease V
VGWPDLSKTLQNGLDNGNRFVILAIDVQYQENSAFVAGILFDDWDAKEPTAEYTSVVHSVAQYEPGSFYKRELPCILALLSEHDLSPSCIVIDGYVYLDGYEKPGLGKRLFDAVEKISEVIGVAKKPFTGISAEFEVLRGLSEKPLYVTTTGRLEEAKHKVISMYGEHRIPVLLKRADRLCREATKG